MTADIYRLMEREAVEQACEDMTREFTDWVISQQLGPETPLELMVSPKVTHEQRRWITSFVRRWAAYAEGIRA